MRLPGSIGTVQICGLKLGKLLVGIAHGSETATVLGIRQLCRVSRHGPAKVSKRHAAVSVLEGVAMAREPPGVDVHGFEKTLHACEVVREAN